jgi:hypothetical protein
MSKFAGDILIIYNVYQNKDIKKIDQNLYIIRHSVLKCTSSDLFLFYFVQNMCKISAFFIWIICDKYHILYARYVLDITMATWYRLITSNNVYIINN